VTTFSELFAVGAGGTVTTHSYNGSTQGGPNIPVQSPDDYLYTTFGIANGSQTFSKMDYGGNFTSLYTFGPGFPAYSTMFLGRSGDFYGVWQPSNTTAGIYSISPTGSFSWIVPPFASGGNNNQSFGLIQASNGNLYGTLPQNGGRSDVPLATRRSAHDHAAPDIIGEIRRLRQCECNIGERSKGDQQESGIASG
jgi:hypothetical protein